MAVQEEIGRWRVGVTIKVSIKHPQRNQRIEEVARTALVQPQLLNQRPGANRPIGEFAENAQFDGAKEDL